MQSTEQTATDSNVRHGVGPEMAGDGASAVPPTSGSVDGDDGNTAEANTASGQAPSSASGADPDIAGLKALRPQNPAHALGLAVNHLMTKTPFRDLKFGAWSRILAGQVNRNHYFFAVENGQIVGFVGWALADRDTAEAWVEGNAEDLGDPTKGDCLVINVWAADSPRITDFMRAELRKACRDKTAVYARRIFADGSIRPVRLGTDPGRVDSHIASRSS